MSTSTATGCVHVSGGFFTPEAARVSALDRGFLLGDGVFESLRTYRGVPFRLDAHLARLEGSLADVGIAGAPDAVVLRGLVLQTLARSGLVDASLRVTISRGAHLGGLLSPADLEPTVVISALPLLPPPAEHYERGISATVLWPRSGSELPGPGVKSTSLQRGVLGRQRAASLGFQEGLYLDAEGNVTEGTFSNVFAVSEGRLLTPPAGVCLGGVTRHEVLELAREEGLEVLEAPLSLPDLLGAQEVFVTSSLAELLPVVRIDERRIGAGAPGPVWRRLLERYRLRTLRPQTLAGG